MWRVIPIWTWMPPCWSTFSQTAGGGLPELVNGLAGLGLYALDRGRPAAASAAILERVLERLGTSCERTAEGLAWYDAPELLYPEALKAMPEGLFDLGVAHGNAGVAGFLAEAAGRVSGGRNLARRLRLLAAGPARASSRWLPVRVRLRPG